MTRRTEKNSSSRWKIQRPTFSSDMSDSEFRHSNATREEIDGSTALVRELHVYGPEVPVGERRSGAWQHAGFGRKLLAEAERKAGEAGASRVLVLSALGTKQYYERLGYSHVGPYMGKVIN